MNSQGIRSIRNTFKCSATFTLHRLHIKNVSCSYNVTTKHRYISFCKTLCFLKSMLSLDYMLHFWICAFATQENDLQWPRFFFIHVCLYFSLFCLGLTGFSFPVQKLSVFLFQKRFYKKFCPMYHVRVNEISICGEAWKVLSALYRGFVAMSIKIKIVK